MIKPMCMTYSAFQTITEDSEAAIIQHLQRIGRRINGTHLMTVLARGHLLRVSLQMLLIIFFTGEEG